MGDENQHMLLTLTEWEKLRIGVNLIERLILYCFVGKSNSDLKKN